VTWILLIFYTLVTFRNAFYTELLYSTQKTGRPRDFRTACFAFYRALAGQLSDSILFMWVLITFFPLLIAFLICGLIYGIATMAAAAPITVPAIIPNTQLPFIVQSLLSSSRYLYSAQKENEYQCQIHQQKEFPVIFLLYNPRWPL
jgi:hypothetical protein